MITSAVYPGTFDPLTLGHFDLIERSVKAFSHLTIAVAAISVKAGAMFSLEERMAMIRETLDAAHIENVDIEPLDGLLVDFCTRRHPVPVVIRGLRVYSDFEYEFQMALTNRKLAPEVETLFMMPQEEHSYVTASMVREIAHYGGDLAPFVPHAVLRHIIVWSERNGIKLTKNAQASLERIAAAKLSKR